MLRQRVPRAAVLIKRVSTTGRLARERWTRPNEVNGARALGTVSVGSGRDRIDHLKRLEADELDLLVIGGGASGCGTSLDAAARGMNVGMLERGDFSSETSSRSTKLVWAGIRYIGTATAALLRFKSLAAPGDAMRNFWGEFKMVLGAHKERRILLENNPHLASWVAIAVPIERWVSWPPPMGHPLFSLAGMMLPLVFKFYDSLSSFTCPPSYVLNKRRAREIFPQLDSARMKYTQVFYEGMHNDSRTCLSIALTAAEHGAAIANYTEVVQVLFQDPENPKRASGVLARDNLTGKEFEVRAKSIVFAGGPFTDGLRTLEDPAAKPAVNGAAGTHIVLPGYFSASTMGLLDINTSDGRFLFFLPWQGHTIVGTTDSKSKALSSPAAPEEEIQWILEEVKKYLSPHLMVRRSDVLSAWRGWRPLAVDPHAAPDAPPSRDHTISTNPESQITFLCGGKWTTYREMAQDVVDHVLANNSALAQVAKTAKPCTTAKIPLLGAEGYSPSLHIELVQAFNISSEVAMHLAHTYGGKAWEVCKLSRTSNKRWPRFGINLVEGYPHQEAEVVYACRNEFALTVKDMLSLRMRMAFLNSEAAKEAAPRVAEIMARELRWSDEQRDQMLADALRYFSEFGGPYPKSDSRASQAGQELDLRELFRRLDHDRSGYIDQVELLNAAKSLGFDVGTKDELKELFLSLPGGSDTGRIYEEQFVHYFKSNMQNEKVLRRIDERFRLSVEKLEDNARGVMFG